MQRSSRRRGFTLIELMTVIAIITILAAILFPLAGTVREQARAGSCMSNLHQLWVSANVYFQDEGAFPSMLYGHPEYRAVSPATGQCSDPKLSSGVPYGTNPDHPCAGADPVHADSIINGFLFPEQTKNSQVYFCTDSPLRRKDTITTAHFSIAPPRYWPAGASWIGKVLADYGCPTDALGVVDCYVGGPYDKAPKYYYTWDCYDIGPAVNANSQPVLLNQQTAFMRHYTADWSGVRGASDLPNQLKYQNPPDDKTLLAFCTWHARSTGSGTAPAVSMTGVAKKVSIKHIIDYGPNVFNF